MTKFVCMDRIVLMEWKVLLKNAPATFQSLLNIMLTAYKRNNTSIYWII